MEDASSDRLSEVVSPKELSNPVPQRMPTRKEIGQWRRLNVTRVNSHVTACNHPVKFSATRSPNSNCISCWTAFFYTSCDLEGIHVVLTKQGVKALITQRGEKFVKMFRGFLSTNLLPKLNAEAEQLIPADPTVIEGSSIV
jgi:hypothetical protein